ncbi:acyl-CoA dehydrogenase family protein [Microvirga sp. SRT01]|uniref:Acyl-CoA dehydrogenase family protein n=1 Tax=Sphingomonas longa TaxID=2778730 RepID=A0ABS2DAB5_9SPHN|nr:MULTISPECIES: acyl-CoA dehydrogenase family protein [Alphaproteobacteria]MBM6577828.1 acyl-CoA dehydrogenase family protein [Sphingomonas sp. BT552]MBR7710870.1 acyl-CoA dehydrogenase family protein [Microvirga sp. SRT01]
MSFAFPPTALPAKAEQLRAEVRAFLAEWGAGWTLLDRAHSWTRFDRDFSRAVGARGWIGMTWPTRYGGQARSSLERYVVLEEMLAAGAPVGAHWFGDRQSGPLLLRSGTEKQRVALLPRIVTGELAFCIGLSEPDSGSDLASLRTRATREGSGWRLDGTKVWTTNAHRSDYMIALVRTSPTGEGAPRQAGLTQFLIDLTLPGISIKPIADLTGEAHFNEVHFDGTIVDETMMIGREGEGWAQANAELAYERSGPDRYLSSFPVLQPALDRLGEDAERHDDDLGRLVARYATLRGMSVSTAGMLERGLEPLQEAALIKDLGVDLEQETPAMLADMLDIGPALPGDGGLEDALAFLTQTAPSFSLRGGTREIMRGMTARGLGLR